MRFIKILGQNKKQSFSLVFIIIIFFNSCTYGQNPNEIIKKHYKAIGGLEKINNLKSILKKRDILLKQVGATIKSEILIKKDEVIKVHLFPSSVSPEKSELYSKSGTQKKEKNSISELSKERAKYFSKVLKDFPSPFLTHQFSFLKKENVNGELCYVLKRQDGNLYWINSKNYLLVKSFTNLYHDELGWLKITTVYSDFKPVNGVLFPFKEEILEYNQQINITSIKINDASIDYSFKGKSSKKTNKKNILENKKVLLKNPDEIAQKAFKNTNSYYAAVKSLEALENNYKSNPLLKSFYYDFFSTVLASAGAYKKALEVRDLMNGTVNNPSRITLDLNKFKAYNAISEIEKIADKNRAIFINEAHHVPQHRAFTHQLLKKLYDKGFRYFAAETLTEADTKKLENQNTIHSYINEPEYANLVRAAISIGYKIISYEQVNALYVNANSSKEEQMKSIMAREEAQAKNLKEKIFDKDKNAKVLVHAGYDHILEKEHFGFKMMAAKFKEITGINPFTIDQVGLMEKGNFELSDVNYKHIIKELNPNDYIVLKNSKNEYFKTEDKIGKVDMQLVHPKTIYLNGRPNWKTLRSKRKLKIVSLTNSLKEGMAEVFLKNDSSNIPVDRIYLNSKLKTLHFYIPKGDYDIRVTDKNGKIQLEKTLNVN